MTWIVIYAVLAVIMLLLSIGAAKGHKIKFWRWVYVVFSCVVWPLGAVILIGQKIIKVGEKIGKAEK